MRVFKRKIIKADMQSSFMHAASLKIKYHYLLIMANSYMPQLEIQLIDRKSSA